jgi:hypothetical protein
VTFAIITNTASAVEFSAMLRRAFGWDVAKKAAPWADASPRTVEDWLQGRKQPGGLKILRMLHHAGFRAQMRALCDAIEKEEAAIAARIERLEAERADLVLARNAAGARRNTGRPRAISACGR